MMTIATKTAGYYGEATKDITDEHTFGDLTVLLDAFIEDGLIVKSSYKNNNPNALNTLIEISSNETANKVVIRIVTLKQDKVTGNFLQEVGGIIADLYSDGIMVMENLVFNVLTSCINCKDILCNFVKTGKVPAKTV